MNKVLLELCYFYKLAISADMFSVFINDNSVTVQ